MSFMDHVQQQPLWVQLWVAWMVLLNTACLVFLRHKPARWVLVAWIGNLISMQALFDAVGFVRLLGLSHVVWWTPLVAYLATRSPGAGESVAYARWYKVLVATIVLSLLLDYVDVARWVLGDRGVVEAATQPGAR